MLKGRAKLFAASTRVLAGASLMLAWGFTTIARADDIKMLHNIGDARKSVRAITHYEVNEGAHSLDMTAATTNGAVSAKVEREVASETAHEICAEGRVSSGWTVRIFMPGESSPVASCRFGGRAHTP